MLRKTTIIIAVITVVLAGGLSPAVTRGEDNGRLTAQGHDTSEKAFKPAVSEQLKEKENVGNEYCPVSGEKIDEKTKVTYEYKGKVYNFCCQDCVEEFKKNPEEYIEKMKKAETGRKDQSIYDRR
jgi:YHS domain-containing protein